MERFNTNWKGSKELHEYKHVNESLVKQYKPCK